MAGPAIDGIVKLMSRMNKGTFGKSSSAMQVEYQNEADQALSSSLEPEFRLPIMVTYVCFTATGFFAWGQSLSANDPWPVPIIVCMGLINLGVQLGTTGVVAYVSDAHRNHASEAFAVMNFVKNLFAFGLTFYVNDWIAVQGVKNCFFVIGGITVACVLTTIPMYIFGKRARSFTFRHRLVTRLDKLA